MNTHPIDEAAKIIGSQAALAKELGVSKAAVNQWKLPGREVPAEHCPEIERLTNGVVRCEELNDKVDWAVLRTDQTSETQHSRRITDVKKTD